jgi:hypothetical protein
MDQRMARKRGSGIVKCNGLFGRVLSAFFGDFLIQRRGINREIAARIKINSKGEFVDSSCNFIEARIM